MKNEGPCVKCPKRNSCLEKCEEWSEYRIRKACYHDLAKGNHD